LVKTDDFVQFAPPGIEKTSDFDGAAS